MLDGVEGVEPPSELLCAEQSVACSILVVLDSKSEALVDQSDELRFALNVGVLTGLSVDERLNLEGLGFEGVPPCYAGEASG